LRGEEVACGDLKTAAFNLLEKDECTVTVISRAIAHKDYILIELLF
jgi:hypothetical protein